MFHHQMDMITRLTEILITPTNIKDNRNGNSKDKTQ